MAGSARSVDEDVRRKVPGKLSQADKHVIRGMLARKDRISDVAYWFGVSPSTVHGIKKAASKMAWTLNDATADLPPPGPYALVQRAELDTVKSEHAAATAMVRELEKLLAEYRKRQVR